MAGGFRDKSLEEIKEDVARMNNPIQYEKEKKDAEKLKKQVEQQIHQDKLDRAKPNSELTEKEILLRILDKLDDLVRIGQTEESYKLKQRSDTKIDGVHQSRYY
jgi:hypothetical protein